MVKQAGIRRGDWPSRHVDRYRGHFGWHRTRVLSLAHLKNFPGRDSPAGDVNFASKITDGKLKFKSGNVPIDAEVAGASMTLQTVNPSAKGREKTASIKLSPLWRLSSRVASTKAGYVGVKRATSERGSAALRRTESRTGGRFRPARSLEHPWKTIRYPDLSKAG